MLGVIIIAALAGLCQGQTRQRPWQEQDKYWKMKVDRLGEDATLNCTVNGPPPYGNNSLYTNLWMLNNLTFINKSSEDGKYVFDHDQGLLTIVNVTRQDFGMYHCIRNLTAECCVGHLWMIRRGLNLQGPYFENLAEKYRNNIIIGVSVCLGFVAFMAMVCLSYQFRWPRLQERFGLGPTEERTEMRPYERPSMYENAGYRADNGYPVQTDGHLPTLSADVSRL